MKSSDILYTKCPYRDCGRQLEYNQIQSGTHDLCKYCNQPIVYPTCEFNVLVPPKNPHRIKYFIKSIKTWLITCISTIVEIIDNWLNRTPPITDICLVCGSLTTKDKCMFCESTNTIPRTTPVGQEWEQKFHKNK